LDIQRYKFFFSKILPDFRKITVTKVNVTKQNDGKNCGLFSLANALVLAMRENPAKFEWLNDNNQMRIHYRHCIANTEANLFDFIQRRAVRNITRDIDLI
jgi:Ulp1 family protease